MEIIDLSRINIFVAGTWNAARAARHAEAGRHVGRELARHGFDLTAGPGTGFSRYVAEGYRESHPRGISRTYLPRADCVAAAGEAIRTELFDEVIRTHFDYPMRNVLHIGASSGLIAVTGGDGTLQECLVALVDYKLPTVVLRASGVAESALEELSQKYFPSWSDHLLIEETYTTLVPVMCRRFDPDGLCNHDRVDNESQTQQKANDITNDHTQPSQ